MAGNNSGAIDAFNRAIMINPNDAESHYRLGYAYLLSGNTEFAYQEYLQLQRLDKVHAHSLLDSIQSVTKR
jgi:Flp pilus assembly protein TadD